MALNLQVDPFAWIDQWRKTTKTFQWIGLLFQMVFSSFVTFLGICGGYLIAGKSWPISIGYGMVAVSIVLATFFARSPLTRGMMFVRPNELAQKEIEAGEAITNK